MKLIVKAVMSTELTWSGNVDLPKNIDPSDKDAVSDYIKEYARNIDGGEFEPEDGINSGSWNVYDVEFNGEQYE